MRWNGVLRCLFLRKSSFFEPKGSLNWHCLDPATHESHPCSCTFSFARNLLSQCRFRSLSSHSNADAIPCTNTMGLLSQYGGDKQQHVRYYSQNSKAERITWENYLNTWKNFNKSQGDIRQAVTEWQDAGFPSESQPDLLMCCVILNQARNQHAVINPGRSQTLAQDALQKLLRATIQTLMRHLGPAPDDLHLKIDANVLAALANSVNVIGSHQNYSVETDFLYEAVRHGIHNLSFKTVEKVTDSLATTRHYHRVYQELEGQAFQLLCCQARQPFAGMFSDILTNFARLGFKPYQILESPVFHQVKARQLFPVDLVNLMWALAALNECDHPIMAKLWERLVHDPGAISKDIRFFMQIHQAYLAMKFSGQEDKVVEYEKTSLFRQIKEYVALKLRSQLVSSPTEQEMVYCLESMGFQTETKSIAYGIPIEIIISQNKTAIVIEKTVHFYRNRREPVGKTVFKRQLIKNMGFNLICVRAQEWINLRSDRAQQRAFLVTKLKQHGF